MNEGSDRNCLIWENQGWSFLKSNNLDGSEEKFVGDKLSDPNRSNTSHDQPRTVAKAETKAAARGRKRTASGRKESDEAKCGGDGGGEEESDHEIHIWTERERRKKMRNMFSNLHALLPQLPPKADKSTIVDEAVNYIKTLQNTLHKLQNQKLEKLHCLTATMNSNDLSIITSQKLLESNNRDIFLADQGSTSNSTAITPTNNNNTTPFLNIPTVFQTWTSPNVILNVCGEEAHISICCLKKPGILSGICFVLEKYKIEMISAQVSSDHYRCLYMIQAHATGGSTLNQFSEALPLLTVEEIYKQAAGEIMLWATSK
ncbi:PREDICTED: transcription factor bHLH95-like [Nicotiana attenuata]|uniref:Transcription factor bhlh95 n=1 Tax=Nicotiana attenuata TaxID=49451 RepID=A0A1J6J3K1_NICAT|nr:PREDICTED: transcription factor bHLH95-like [Nicotiana attenuata]OIT07272.1 transcription factor bhlh95 [Nicotiana attenuata]